MAYFIDPKTCTGCTACTRYCPTDAITGERKAAHHIDTELCINCGVCGRICQFTSIYNENKVKCQPIPKKSWDYPVWDQENCTACNICLTTCPANAISIDLRNNNHHFLYILDQKKCIGCGFCAIDCPINVITMQSKLK